MNATSEIVSYLKANVGLFAGFSAERLAGLVDGSRVASFEAKEALIHCGAAMLPYTVIKEVNPPELGGSATGVVNFINFTFSALLGPVFGRLLVQLSEGSERMGLEHYQATFKPMLFGVAAAVILTCFLKETGSSAQTRGAPITERRK